MIEDKWSRLRKLHELRTTDALTEEEYEAEKAKLMAGPRLPALPISFKRGVAAVTAIAGALALLALLIAVLPKFSEPTPTGDSAQAANDAAMAASSDAAAAGMAASDAVQASAPDLSLDQTATAFASVYGGKQTEEDGRGSVLALQPVRIVPVSGDTYALISTGELDGGSACHACTGALRFDYLTWNGSEFIPKSPQMRFNQNGQGFGSPPAWKVLKGPGLPTVRVETVYGSMGCESDTITLLKLTPAGITRVSQKSKEDCSAAWLGSSDAAAASDATAAASASGTPQG